jgi:hypothetical protein
MLINKKGLTLSRGSSPEVSLAQIENVRYDNVLVNQKLQRKHNWHGINISEFCNV